MVTITKDHGHGPTEAGNCAATSFTNKIGLYPGVTVGVARGCTGHAALLCVEPG